MKTSNFFKKLMCAVLAIMLLCAELVVPGTTANAAYTNSDATAEMTYGLMSDVQDGVILHCWDWSYNNIKAQIPTIAAAGYSAIQTSPIQEAKESTKGKGNDMWWVFYQPKSFYIDNSGNSALGTKAEFIAMCDEAHKYGVKVLVDVVANHLGNQSGYDKASVIAADIRNDSECWHDIWNQEINYGNRYSITHGSMGGLPDLNTENEKIQTYVLNFLKECIDAGADGFRFDAAKHISVSAEGAEYTFWENTLEKAKVYAKTSRNIDLYAYGEILDGTNGPSISSYTKYMSVTENRTSNDIRHAVASGNASGAATSNFAKGTAAENLVMWAESHDTYSNESQESTSVSAANINKTWALVASRANASALYFARTNGYRAGTIGTIGTWDWKNKEVAEVNKFHNYFHGESEYLSSSGSIAYNERGTSGVVLVNCSGTTTSVNVKANRMADGEYTDHITGNKFTVSNGNISGNIGSTGIAVVYKDTEGPQATISMKGGEYSTETITITIGLKNAISGTYKIDSMSSSTYTTTKNITIGGDLEVGESTTIVLTATDGNVTNTFTYTFTKVDDTTQPEDEGFIPPYERGVYFINNKGWSNVNVYYWTKTNTNMVAWPGVPMVDLGGGLYGYEMPAGVEPENIIFNNGYSQSADLTFVMNGIYENDVVKEIATINGEVLVKYVDESGKSIADSETLNGKSGTNYLTEAKEIDGYKLIETPVNATGKYTWTKIEVIYKYKKTQSEDPSEKPTEPTDPSTGETTEIKLDKVKNFGLKNRTDSNITLKWNRNTNADGYVIQQYKSGKWKIIKTLTSNKTVKYTVKGLSSSTSYKFRIKAYKVVNNQTINSAYANKTIKTLPSKVKGFKASSKTKKSITLKWTKNNSADGYIVQQYKNKKWKNIKVVKSKKKVTLKVNNLKSGQKYKFRIKTYKTNGKNKLYGAYTTINVKTS